MRLLHWLRPVAVGTAIGFCLAAVLLLTRLSTGAVTCTDTWIATDGNWASAANWSKGSVPGEGDTACITGTGTYTVLVNSNSPVVVSTLTLGAASGTQTLVIGSGIAFYGSITVNASGILTLGDGDNGDTLLGCYGSCIAGLSNSGQLKTVQGGGGTRRIQDDVNNLAGGTVDLAAADTEQEGGLCGTAGRGITNHGAVTVEPAGHLTIACGGFDNEAGTLANNGSVGVGGGGGSKFFQRGGVESGNPVVLSSGSLLDDDTSAASGSFTFVGPPNPSTGNPNTLTGSGSSPGVAAEQVVTLASGGYLHLASMTNAGTILMGDAGSGDTTLGCYGGCIGTLTNSIGLLKTVQGGGGMRDIEINVANGSGGSLDVAAANTVQGGGLCGTSGRGITNNGAVTVESAANLTIACGGFDNEGGTLANNGGVGIGGGGGSKFYQRGGVESGNPVVISNGSLLDDDTSAGAGSFTFVGPPNPSTGNPNTLTGTGSSPGVAAGQVVTLASGAYLHVASVTNAGSIFVGDAGNGDTTLGCYGGCHPTLSNTGLLKTIQGGGGVRHIQVNIVNAIGGTVDMAALDTREDGGCGGGGLVNNGGLTLETGVTFAEDCSFTQASTGTFATTIDATAASYGQMSGGVVSLDGKLKVTSVGVPATGTSYGVIANAARTGTFASWDLRGVNYWRQYVPTGLNLVAEGTCDTWIGGVDAKFGTALNWSFGVPPGIAVDGCITATTTSHPPANADTYGVTADSNPAVHSLTLGATNGTQTLTIPSGRAVDTAADSLIGGHGVLKLGDTASGDSRFGCAGGGCATANPTLTNGGSLQTVAGGGGTRRFQQVIINNLAAGRMDVSGSTILQGGCQPGGGANNNRGFLNSGSVTVGNTQLTAACGFVNNVAAAVSNGGLFLVDGSVFKQRGALSGGFAVILTNGSVLDDDTSAAGGTFTLTGGSGGLHGTGTSPGIPVGSNVTVASGTTVQVSPNMTNAGSLILGDSGSGDTTLCCSFFTGGPTITNSGTIRTAQGGGGIRHIQVNIANSGSMMFAADDNRQDASCGDHATWVINDGAFSIGDGSRYTLNSCPVTASHANTFTQHLGATLHTAVNADGGKFGQLVGGVVTLDGRLEVMTFGFPPVGSSWPIISGSERSGQFVDLYVAYPPYDVQVQYVPTGVNVVYARSVSCFGARPPWPCQAAMPQPQPPRSGTGWWKQPRR